MSLEELFIASRNKDLDPDNPEFKLIYESLLNRCGAPERTRREKEDAEEILERLLGRILLDSRRRGQVGEFVTRLSEEDREKLKKLKSDDIVKIRFPWK